MASFHIFQFELSCVKTLAVPNEMATFLSEVAARLDVKIP